MGARGWEYQRRRPEVTVSYAAVRGHLATLLAEASEMGPGLLRYAERAARTVPVDFVMDPHRQATNLFTSTPFTSEIFEDLVNRTFTTNIHGFRIIIRRCILDRKTLTYLFKMAGSLFQPFLNIDRCNDPAKPTNSLSESSISS